MAEPSPHVAKLIGGEPAFESELGVITQVTASSLPILAGLSAKRITLQPGALREPQWNVNANQLAYVVSGTVLVSILGDGDVFSSFIVRPGQMYHVESGSIYHIENIGDDAVEIIAALRTEVPRHFSLQNGFNAMTDNVLGNTYDLPGSAFAAFDRHHASQIVARAGSASVPDTAGLPNAHLFDVETQAPSLNPDYGSARFARRQFWAALDDISMYSLRIGGAGMREPHWHPITGEMGYVQSGHGRMTVLDPSGALDTYELEPGQVYFIPRAYPHHIESLGDEGVHFLIFFDQPMPADIGYRATASAFSREVLSSAFGVAEKDLPTFPFTPIDPLLVGRPNPRDSIAG